MPKHTDARCSGPRQEHAVRCALRQTTLTHTLLLPAAQHTQANTAQHSATQHSAARAGQHSAAQYSTCSLPHLPGIHPDHCRHISSEDEGEALPHKRQQHIDQRHLGTAQHTQGHSSMQQSKHSSEAHCLWPPEHSTAQHMQRISSGTSCAQAQHIAAHAKRSMTQQGA
jgi:hypothetical protein